MKTEIVATCWTTAGQAKPLADDESSPEPLVKRIELAGAAGFSGFGLLHADLDKVIEQDRVADLARMLNDNGLRFLELEFLTGWFNGGPEREEADRRWQRFLEVASVVPVRNVKVGGNFDGSEASLEIMTNAFGHLCEQAATCDVSVTLEPMPYTNIRTTADGLAITRGANQSNGGLMIDIWHVARAGVDYDWIRTLNRDDILGVEVDDAATEPVGTLLEDTINERRLPGEGSLDIASFVAAVASTGYEGPVGVEIIAAQHRSRPIVEAIPAAFDAAQRFLG